MYFKEWKNFFIHYKINLIYFLFIIKLLFLYKFFNLINNLNIELGIGDWGIGGGGWGVWDWAQTPNPKSPIPNPQSPLGNHTKKNKNIFL